MSLDHDLIDDELRKLKTDADAKIRHVEEESNVVKKKLLIEIESLTVRLQVIFVLFYQMAWSSYYSSLTYLPLMGSGKDSSSHHHSLCRLFSESFHASLSALQNNGIDDDTQDIK